LTPSTGSQTSARRETTPLRLDFRAAEYARTAAPFLIKRPPEMLDPIFEHELALELKMSVAELRHGRGAQMPASELLRDWPLFFESRKRMAEREEQREAGKAMPTMGRGG
jgi:hypothetical protein